MFSKTLGQISDKYLKMLSSSSGASSVKDCNIMLLTSNSVEPEVLKRA